MSFALAVGLCATLVSQAGTNGTARVAPEGAMLRDFSACLRAWVGERVLTDVSGLTAEDIFAERAGRLLNLKGAAEKPLRDVRVRNVRATKVAHPDVVENVEMPCR